MARHPKTGRIPPSRFYKSGSKFPKYRKPVSFKALPEVAKVTGGKGSWLVEFADGMGVQVNESQTSPGRFYTLKVHDRVRWYEEARPEPPPDVARRYQYAALTSIIPHQASFHIDPYGSVMGDLNEELYPVGADRSLRRTPRRRRDATDRFTASERSGRARMLTGVSRRGGSHTYASPEVKRTASYKRAERLEDQLAPQRWNTPGLSRSDYERLADAWERAGFFGWADNYRAHVERHRIGRDRRRRRDPVAQYPGPRSKRTRAWAVVTNSGPERGFSTFFSNKADAVRSARRRRARGEDVRIDRVMPYKNWKRIGY